MKLEYLEDVNEYGDDVIRLYDFDKIQAEKLSSAIKNTVIDNEQSLDLSTLDFIENINCKLILHIAEDDEGILTHDQKVFFCDLTVDGYRNMIRLMEPFTKKDTRSFQMLYDLDTEIDFLFSPYGESAL
ncbi:MAG: hypothetical protein K0S44_1798 [Bacteroidetes bacterium]|jgi:hypothetical protein|nr:hypothetical protein [Bacteroidota bacterium]